MTIICSHNISSASNSNCIDRPPKQGMYNVKVVERDSFSKNDSSWISKTNGTSDFQFNFAAAWFPRHNTMGEEMRDGLVVRLVDMEKHPEWSNAGALAIIRASMKENRIWAEHITEDHVTWEGSKFHPSKDGQWGAVDPRITYRPDNQMYYLTWDNCTKNCWPQRITYLSTTRNPFDPSAWTLHGPVFPWEYTSGASLLFRNDDDDDGGGGPHLAFVANSNTADKIFIAESNNGIQWKIPDDPKRRVLMEGRPGCWDSVGVAAGPQPERLSSGDYLYIYNIDTGWPYQPNPLGRCSVGWAILDGHDPTIIVARAQEPLLVPQLAWEVCPEGRSDTCQVPAVVFSTGIKPIKKDSYFRNDNNVVIEDDFYLIYGGADSNVGISKIKVQYQSRQVVDVL